MESLQQLQRQVLKLACWTSSFFTSDCWTRFYTAYVVYRCKTMCRRTVCTADSSCSSCCRGPHAEGGLRIRELSRSLMLGCLGPFTLRHICARGICIRQAMVMAYTHWWNSCRSADSVPRTIAHGTHACSGARLGPAGAVHRSRSFTCVPAPACRGTRRYRLSFNLCACSCRFSEIVTATSCAIGPACEHI